DQPGYSFVGKDTDLSTNDDYYIVFFVLRKDLPLERARATLTSLGIDYFYTPSEGYASVKIAREGDFSQIGCESLLN
ncbi:hypothetical protein KY308_00205, partial [Candidatus Woesearchaeota archaeon]|nr:hypothetical protein [Candidatus Woesearchaeota archaeon]